MTIPEVTRLPAQPVDPRTRWALAAVVGCFWIMVVVFMLGHSYCLYDDAYIYFRFVEQTFAGCPFAYNCVDGPVEGFTSPLYFVLLLAGRLVTPDLESLSQLLGALFLGLAGTVAILTAASPHLDAGRPATFVRVARGAAVAALLGLDHFFLLYSVIGLETALATLWGVLLLRCALDPRQRWLRTMAILGVFVRPEFALFVLLLVLFAPQGRRVRYWLPMVAVGVVTVLSRWLVFGDLLPNTFWAKSGGTLEHARLGWQYLQAALSDFPLILLAPPALLLVRPRTGIGYFLLGSLGWLAYFLRSGGDFFEYSRMAIPLVTGLTVLAVAGVFALVHLLFAQRVSVAALGPAVALSLLGLFAARAATVHRIPEQHGMARVERWSAVGRFLAKEHPGVTVAATPVGAIGYFSGARILDLVGLVDRTVAKEGARIPDLNSKGKIGHEKVHTDYILAQQPEIIIIDAWKREPWGKGDQVFTQFRGEWELIDAIASGRAPYRPYTPQVGENLYWFMFMRVETPHEVGTE